MLIGEKSFISDELKKQKLFLFSILSLLVASFLFLYPERGVQNSKNKDDSGPTKLSDEKVVTAPEGATGGVLGDSQTSRTTLPATASPKSFPTSAEPTTPPTLTPIPEPLSPTPTPTATPVIETVRLRIETPHETVDLRVPLKSGNDVCSILITAKNEGGLRSLTIDDSYKQTYQSAYVVEINGYRDNWTFTVNGITPRGCSLFSPKKDDVVVWRFF